MEVAPASHSRPSAIKARLPFCLLRCFRKFGIPKTLRTDNEASFKSRLLKAALFLLKVRVKHTAPRSPWQNGRIERLFGSFKADFTRLLHGNLATLLTEWRWYYNFARPHQHLRYKTPAESWDGRRKATGRPHRVELWDGQLKCLYFESG
jgi:putative transposase